MSKVLNLHISKVLFIGIIINMTNVYLIKNQLLDALSKDMFMGFIIFMFLLSVGICFYMYHLSKDGTYTLTELGYVFLLGSLIGYIASSLIF